MGISWLWPVSIWRRFFVLIPPIIPDQGSLGALRARDIECSLAIQ